MPGAIALCALIWAGAAWFIQRCWRTWRGGADLLAQRRWDALSGALMVGALATMSLILLPFLSPSIPALGALALLMASAGCAVVRSVLTRRTADQDRSLRSDLGLPTERRLRQPTTVMLLWGAAGALTTVAYLLVVATMVYAATEPSGRQLVVEEAAVNRMVLVFGGFLTAGAVHALAQYRRRQREQDRVRGEEQRFLEDSRDPEAS